MFVKLNDTIGFLIYLYTIVYYKINTHFKFFQIDKEK